MCFAKTRSSWASLAPSSSRAICSRSSYSLSARASALSVVEPKEVAVPDPHAQLLRLPVDGLGIVDVEPERLEEYAPRQTSRPDEL